MSSENVDTYHVLPSCSNCASESTSLSLPILPFPFLSVPRSDRLKIR